MVDTLNTLTAEQKIFYELEMLWTARQSQVFYQWGKKTNVPRNGGNQANWRRWEALGLSTTAITPGINPAATPATITPVTSTVNEYGNYVVLDDQILMMGIDQLMSEGSQRLGQNGGESVEQIIVNTIENGTNLIYATGTSKANQSASSPMTMSLARAAVANLENNRTPKFSGGAENNKIGLGNYIGFVHPFTAYDMLSDQEIKNAFEYRDTQALYQGSLGMTYNIEWYMSTLCPVYKGAGSAGANVYGAIIVGRDAFGIVDVAGSGKFQLITHDVGTSGVADALNLQASIGWKSYQAPAILNNNFMVQIICGSAAPGA